MLAKTINPYLDFIRNKYPTYTFLNDVPFHIKPEHVMRVIYENEMIEIMLKSNGKIFVAIMDQGEGQRAIMRLKKQIAARSNPLERFELWECRCVQGFYDMSMEFRLINSRMSEEERGE